jgi:uncharacterized RDD family membrane protein YckC
LSDASNTTPATAGDGEWPPAWIRRGRRYFLGLLIFFLSLYVICLVVLNSTPQHSGLHSAAGWVIVVSVAAALLALVLLPWPPWSRRYSSAASGGVPPSAMAL